MGVEICPLISGSCLTLTFSVRLMDEISIFFYMVAGFLDKLS